MLGQSVVGILVGVVLPIDDVLLIILLKEPFVDFSGRLLPFEGELFAFNLSNDRAAIVLSVGQEFRHNAPIVPADVNECTNAADTIVQASNLVSDELILLGLALAQERDLIAAALAGNELLAEQSHHLGHLDLEFDVRVPVSEH